jgi:exopolyphosphatase/pppGpp-phosphohydrolase
MDATRFEAEIRSRYAAIRDGVAAPTLITVLHIGADHTGIAVGSGPNPQRTLALAIGSDRTAREHFSHSPPTPLELENAIAVVEDEVARARPMIPQEANLYTTDAVVGKIAALSGVSDGASMKLTQEAMERTFDRLTSVALGKPASHEGLPDSNTFAATLLILREFMHHMQFSAITILSRTARVN